MTQVVTLTESDILRLRAIVMDADGADALAFVKERLLRQIDESLRKGMDTSKGHL